MNNKELQEIFSYYDFDFEQYVGIREVSIGHINVTNIIYFDYGNRVKRYLLQRINTNVFKNPDHLMQNIKSTTTYGKNLLKSFGVDNYKNKVVRIYQTLEGKDYVKTQEGSYYRVYHYVENGISYNTSNNPKIFIQAGKTIGFFQNMLANYPADKLYEIIPHFHDTPYRYNTFLKALENANKEKIEMCKDEIAFYKENKEIAYSIQPLIDNGTMPLRVTHNDTKLNNIMFDFDSNEGLCLVDLDTIMPGSICYDFGDFVRSGCNMGEEDSKDLSKVVFNKELFLTFARGYISSVVNSITQVELNNLTMGAILMTYECGMRFLTDYLEGNTYFKAEYEEHNLVRCRTQISMTKQLLSCKEELDKEIIKIYNELI